MHLPGDIKLMINDPGYPWPPWWTMMNHDGVIGTICLNNNHWLFTQYEGLYNGVLFTWCLLNSSFGWTGTCFPLFHTVNDRRSHQTISIHNSIYNNHQRFQDGWSHCFQNVGHFGALKPWSLMKMGTFIYFIRKKSTACKITKPWYYWLVLGVKIIAVLLLFKFRSGHTFLNPLSYLMALRLDKILR